MTDLATTGYWTALFVASDWAIRLVMLPIVPTRRSPEAAKGWLLFIFFLPWFGLAASYLRRSYKPHSNELLPHMLK